MKNIDIKIIDDFIQWTYDNGYLYSHSRLQKKFGWLTKEQIRYIGNMTERDNLRKTTAELYSEFLINYKK
jgi:hypothetical protein